MGKIIYYLKSANTPISVEVDEKTFENNNFKEVILNRILESLKSQNVLSFATYQSDTNENINII
jgi:hypothetical protein